MNANEFCATIAEEVNLKQLTFETGLLADDNPLTLRWDRDGLDLYVGEKRQFKPELAATLLMKCIVPNLCQSGARPAHARKLG